jgi:phosphate/sulfate permease
LYVAYSIGANNAANASGPIASMTANELNISLDKNFILILLLSFAPYTYLYGKKGT